MNPLGLLAGLGALNALSGGELGAKFGGKAATGKRFTGILDMLDGGGAGASGDKFEGGGLLSILGNLFAKPLEAQDNVERIAARTSARDILRPKLRPEGLLSEAQKEQIVMGQIVNPDVYNIGQGGEFAGSMLAPRATTAQSAAMEDAYSTTAPLSAPAPSYATMPMGEAGRGGMLDASAMRQPAGTPTIPYESNEAFRQQAIELYGQGFLDLTPTSQARIIEGLRLGASRSAY